MSQEHDKAWTQCLAAELKLRLRKRNTVLVLVDEPRDIVSRFLTTSKEHFNDKANS